MRIIFAGTPDFACESLKALIQAKFNVVAVYTQPDRAKGRNKKITESPVKTLAKEYGIAIEQPENFKNTATINKFADYQPDIFVVAAYGIILPEKLLQVSALNINVHASLLPKWRGAAPIQYAIMHDDKITGISIMEIIKELDAGPVINQASIAIDNLAADKLTLALGKLGADLLVDTISNINKLWPNRTPQLAQYVSHAPKIKKEDGLIDWHQPAKTIDCKIRALNNWPKAYYHHKNSNIKVISAKVTAIKSELNPGTCIIDKNQIFITTADFNLELLSIQLPNKNIMTAKQIICGYKELLLD